MDSYTISNSIEITGIGIHTNAETTFHLEPMGRPSSVCISWYEGRKEKFAELTPENYTYAKRTSAITHRGNVVATCPEHLFAALAIHGIDSIWIRLPGSCEIPSTPNGQRSYYDIIRQTGVKWVSKKKVDHTIMSPITMHDKGRAYSLKPSTNGFKVAVTQSYPMGKELDTSLTLGVHKNIANLELVARARSWVFEDRLNTLRDSGLCLGLNEKNALILSKSKFEDNHVLMEATRHKMYDLLGDLYLLGCWPHIEIHAYNPNHRLNNKLLNTIIAVGKS